MATTIDVPNSSLVNDYDVRYQVLGGWKMATVDLQLTGAYSGAKVPGLNAFMTQFGFCDVFQIWSIPKFAAGASGLSHYLKYEPSTDLIRVFNVEPTVGTGLEEDNEIAGTLSPTTLYRIVVFGR